MDYNPYAAPTVDDQLLGPGAAGAGAPQPWEVGEVLGLGWEAVKRDWPVLVFAPFLSGILSGIPGIILNIVVQVGIIQQFTATYWTVYALVTLLDTAIQSFFTVGLLRIYCSAA